MAPEARTRRRTPVLGSLARILRLTWLEMVKLVGHKLYPCTVGITLALTVGLAVAGMAFSQGGATVKFSNYSLWVVSSTYALRIAIVLLVAQAAMSMSSEASARTLNTILVRPMRRIEFITAKALSLVLATVIVFLASGVSGFVMGGMVRDPLARGRTATTSEGEREGEGAGSWPSYGDVVDPLYPDTVIATRWEVMQSMLTGYGLLLVPALAAVSVGFALGTLIDSTGLSIGLSVGVSVTLVVGEFFPVFADYLARFGYNHPVPIIATNMLDAGKGSLPVWDDALFGAGVSAIYVVVSLLVAYLYFWRRDVTL
ncbi:MAG: ABC transporter permease [Planctomycetota bacterium]